MHRLTLGPITLCCPGCREPLSNTASGLKCLECGTKFPVRDGIPSFCDPNQFYEGKFAATEPDPISARRGIAKATFRLYVQFSQSHLRNRFTARMIGPAKRGRVILDMGCGGGTPFLARMGQVVGADLSLASLQNARRIYSQTVQCDASSTPFPDESFDFIVSRDLLGHIPPKEKNCVLKEMFRLCRNGGRIIHAIEVESRNPVWRFARRYPSLFRKYFVEQYGHYGLETPEVTCRRLEDSGFRRVQVSPVFKTGVVRASQYVAMFDNEYRRGSRFVNLVVTVAKAVDARPSLRAAHSYLAGMVDALAGGLLPLDWAQLLLVCYEKETRVSKQKQYGLSPAISSDSIRN